MSYDENLRDLLDSGIEERLPALAKSNKYTIWTKKIDKILRTWYPELSEKEVVVCSNGYFKF